MNTIKICGTDIGIKEYKGQRVVTFKDIDAVHGRPDGTARKRFNGNKEHFIEGVDFFKVSYSENIERPNGGRSIFDEVNNLEGYRGMDYSGYVFMAQDDDTQYWKIGRTKVKRNTEKRLNLARTKELKNYLYFDCADTLKADKIIKERLCQYNVKNSWYDCDRTCIEDVVKQVVEEVTKGFNPREYHKGGYHGEIYLITESGYLMLVKSFTDDLAWHVQRELVSTYFRFKQITSDPVSDCYFLKRKDLSLKWKRKIATPLITRLSILQDLTDVVKGYSLVYKAMIKDYKFDMNAAKEKYSRKYNIPLADCAIIDVIADEKKYRKQFVRCATKLVKEQSNNVYIIAKLNYQRAKQLLADVKEDSEQFEDDFCELELSAKSICLE